MPRRVTTGIVTSDKMDKTRRVEIHRLMRHPRYEKQIRRRTVCIVHDEGNESHAGDTVEIIESRPRSKRKRWELVRVVQRSQAVDVAAVRAEQSEGETSEMGEAGAGEGAGGEPQ